MFLSLFLINVDRKKCKTISYDEKAHKRTSGKNLKRLSLTARVAAAAAAQFARACHIAKSRRLLACLFTLKTNKKS